LLSDVSAECGLAGDTARWQRGALSNLEYLLALNGWAGRRWGDMRFHYFVPWPLDFSRHPGEGLRQTECAPTACALLTTPQRS